MRIEFESKDEIRRLATVLQDIHPHTLIITVESLVDTQAACGDGEHPIPLPWEEDGFHVPIMPIVIDEEAPGSARADRGKKRRESSD